MSFHDIEDATRGLTSSALTDIIRRGRGSVAPDMAAVALLGRNQRRPLQAARTILQSREKTVDQTRAAIRALGHSTERGTQELLLGGLREPDPIVLRETVWSLARIGNEEALERLRQVDPRRTEKLRPDIIAAQRLLAFRLGKSGFGFKGVDLPKRAEFAGDELRDMKASEPDREALEKGLRMIEMENAGLDLVSEKTTQLTCLRENLWLMPSKMAFTEPEALSRRPCVAMGIFNHNGCTGVPYLKSYVLSEPVENGIALVVTRRRGQATHAGSLKVDGSEISFELSALETRFDPAAKIAGRVSREGTVKLDVAQVSTAVLAQLERRRKPLESPARSLRQQPEVTSDQ